MILIDEIGSYIPSNTISNYDRQSRFKIDHHFIEESIGIKYVTRKLPSEETSDMCYKSFKNLLEKVDLKIYSIDCIAVCTQNPDKEGMPSTSNFLHSKIGAREDCPAFDISIGCSGYVYSLSIVKGFMDSNNLSIGLLFTCDPYSKIINEDDKNTALLFGDAATVTLLINDHSKTGLIPKKFIFGTRGSEQPIRKENGTLTMNGRSIYNFAAISVPQQINKLLEQTPLDKNDIDLFIFHQGSKFVVDALRKRLDLPTEKVPIVLENHGNTVSSTIPLILKRYLHNEDYKKIIISGFGIGLSWATALLERD